MLEFSKENQNITIRRARTEDAVELNEFYRTIILETDHFGYEADEFQITDEQQEYTINMFNQADNAILLVATLDDKIVGYLSFRAGSLKKFQHVGEFGIQVLKDYWNLGIGKELVQYLINWAKENETIYKISLRVRADNRNAIHLYKTLGFMEEGILKGEMMCNGTLHDLIYMGIVVD